MRGSTQSDNLQEAKPNTPSRRYPVSARAYKKKDYDYLSTFPSLAHSPVLRTSVLHEDAELSHDKSDGESDLFLTASSVEYATSVSSASSTGSSAQSYAKYGRLAIIPNMDSDDQDVSDLHRHHPHPHHHHHHHHHQHTHHHHHHLLQSTETSTVSSGDSMENPDLEKLNIAKLGAESNVDMKDENSEVPVATEGEAVHVKEGRPRPRTKAKSRQTDTPAVLPKFGSWDTKNPSSGDAYTLIFRRLRDEKKSGALPVCVSPTHPKVEEVAEPFRQENKEKEPLRSNANATRKDSSRRKAKNTTRKEASPRRPMAWISCCKPSVMDD